MRIVFACASCMHFFKSYAHQKILDYGPSTPEALDLNSNSPCKTQSYKKVYRCKKLFNLPTI